MTRLTHASKSTPCPICANTDWCYELNDSLWGCKRSDTAPPGWKRTTKQDREGHHLFAVDNGDSSEWTAKKVEWEAKREQREANQLAARQEEFRTSLSAEQRDPLIRALSQELGLTREHRQILKDRGLTDAQIDDGLFFSIEKWQKVSDRYPFNLPGVYLSPKGDRQLSGQGIAIVTIDRAGLATGWQIMSVPRIENLKYYWAKSNENPELSRREVRSHLPVGDGELELPIQVVGSSSTSGVAYGAEGGLKSFIAAHLHSEYFIGASSGNFSGSPIQVRSALNGYHTIVLPVDGGDAINPARIDHWQRQVKFFASLDIKVRFAWWGQISKDNNDVDEITTEQFRAAKILTPGKFFALCRRLNCREKDDETFKALSSLTLPITDSRREQFLQPIPLPRTGYLTFVSSGVWTGKTKQLTPIVDSWTRLFPKGRVIIPGYRNGLLDQLRERLDVPNFRVGYGQDDTAINNYQKLAICLDSLMRLKLENIPPNTLIIHDEFEAILKHIALGGTTGSNTAKVQAHLVAIYHQVLANGGAVICLEDKLTDVSVRGLLDLTDNRYPFEIISNDYERFNWDVSIGGGSPKDYIGLILDRLMSGERIVVPTTSQVFGESLERIVLARLPEMKGYIERVDAKTVGDCSDLIEDPSGYLRAAQTKLLILSPTVESGFSIEDKIPLRSLFDRVMAYFTNLDTRSHIQLLSRYRSNCPRSIFCPTKGAETGDNRGRDPIKLLKVRKQIADRTTLTQGIGRTPTTPQGDVWNRLDAEFSARAALSAKYIREYLEADLIGRGHRVTAVEWASARAQVIIDNGLTHISSEELGNQYKDIKASLETEESQQMAGVDGLSLSPAQAIAILHSSYSTYEQKIQAKKCLLHQDLPGADLTQEFILEVVVKNRGAYRRSCELAYLLDKPDLAKSIDKGILNSQLEQPHILFRKMPKNHQKVDLLAPIAQHLQDLATSREYKANDPAVVAIQEWGLKNSYLFWALFGLTIKAEEIDSIGKRQNTAIATVNKILKKLGYKAEVIRQEGSNGKQIRVFGVTNSECPHRQTIYQALELKYKTYIENSTQFDTIITVSNTELDIKNVINVSTSDTKSIVLEADPPDYLSSDNIESVAETLVVALDQPHEVALEVITDLRTIWERDLLEAAAQLLPSAQRSKLKQIVVKLNKLLEVAA
jgi:hypothetical protein